MLSEPKSGWSVLTVGNFEEEVGYLTNVQLDLIIAFNSFFERGCGAASFECEPYGFDLIFSYSGAADSRGVAYIVDDDKKLYRDGVPVLQLAKAFVKDINDSLDDWADWQFWLHDGNAAERNKALLKNGVAALIKNIEKFEKNLFL